MLESTIELKIKGAVIVMGGLCLKWVSPGFSGVPDRIIILPGGRILFVEVKRPGGKLRPRQQRVHDQMRSLGCEVITVDDADEMIRILKGEDQ